MLSISNVLIVLLLAVIGVGYSSYRIGVRIGAEGVIDHLIDEGILKYEEDDEEES